MDQAARTTALPAETATAAPSGAQLRARLAALADWYATLSPASLLHIDEFYTADARFRDPFNQVHGRDGIADIFRHMFAVLEEPVFSVREQLLDGQQAFITWDFSFRRAGKHYQLHGGSHLRFAADGKVCLHRDYWDSAEELLHKLPLIGAPLRLLRRLLSVHDQGWPV
ncbi:nuclear transport factor 2 family protein [Aquitalea pelogenes]|uniref:nuclear transport factor 2 family protein n=1 Tax=Aquitalea pelogenes TaxID=1293573 RepID=UPI0009E59B6C|nr:nuclear transport factor 2 family protein [Aquitalea pelogenes]